MEKMLIAMFLVLGIASVCLADDGRILVDSKDTTVAANTWTALWGSKVASTTQIIGVVTNDLAYKVLQKGNTTTPQGVIYMPAGSIYCMSQTKDGSDYVWVQVVGNTATVNGTFLKSKSSWVGF